MASERKFRHWGGFIVSGGTASIIDAGITSVLVHQAGIDPFSARAIAIVIAMTGAWILHRRLTFAVSTPPTLREYGRFVAVASGANLLNYAIYVVILLTWPRTLPAVAVVVATAIAACFSYFGFRIGVFREPPPPA